MWLPDSKWLPVGPADGPTGVDYWEGEPGERNRTDVMLQLRADRMHMANRVGYCVVTACFFLYFTVSILPALSGNGWISLTFLNVTDFSKGPSNRYVHLMLE